MEETVLAFLAALEEAVPPGPGDRHVLMLARYGPDEAGRPLKLGLHVKHGAAAHVFFLEKGDLSHPQPVIDHVVRYFHLQSAAQKERAV